MDNQDALIEHNHKLSVLNLLIFMILIILVIVTIWLFKHKRLTYVHETGLGLLYGAIFGAIIRYGLSSSGSIDDVLTLNLSASLIDKTLPIPFVYLNVSNRNDTLIYSYVESKKIDNAQQTSDLKSDFEARATFDPETFFNLLLPPIIFHAGYSLKRRYFFKNFGAILVFAIIGTIISCLSIGAIMYALVANVAKLKEYFTLNDCFLFGAFISATDPVTTLAIFNNLNVDKDLYALVFGESIFNDISSIILAQQIERFDSTSNRKFDINEFGKSVGNFLAIFLGSFAIGCSISCLTSLITKFTYLRNYANLETALFIIMSYSTFLASEAAGFTGIVAVLFCGIFQAHYTFNNLSSESQIQTRQIFDLLNFLTENFIFVYIGISLFTFREQNWNFSFIATSFLAIFVGRAINIYPLAFIINFFRKEEQKIEYNKQHLMVLSGLRGAMAFALAIRNTNNESRRLILTTVSVIVIITIVLCGGATKKLVEVLKIKHGLEIDRQESNLEMKKIRQTRREQLQIKSDDSSANNSYNENLFEASQSKTQKLLALLSLIKIFNLVDSKFLKPLLTNTRPTLIDTMPPRFLWLWKLLTTKEQMLLPNQNAPRLFSQQQQQANIDSQIMSLTNANFNSPRSFNDSFTVQNIPVNDHEDSLWSSSSSNHRQLSTETHMSRQSSDNQPADQVSMDELIY